MPTHKADCSNKSSTVIDRNWRGKACILNLFDASWNQFIGLSTYPVPELFKSRKDFMQIPSFHNSVYSAATQTARLKPEQTTDRIRATDTVHFSGSSRYQTAARPYFSGGPSPYEHKDEELKLRQADFQQDLQRTKAHLQKLEKKKRDVRAIWDREYQKQSRGMSLRELFFGT